jgi:hypothetical protein
MEEIRLLGAHAQPEQLHLSVEGRSVVEDAAKGCRGIKRVSTQTIHRTAESGHVGEGLQMACAKMKRLIGAH